jgi:hypothetical protein
MVVDSRVGDDPIPPENSRVARAENIDATSLNKPERRCEKKILKQLLTVV